MSPILTPLILIADDEAGFVEVMQAKLEAQGLRSLAAVDGNEAVIKAKMLRPTIILMDIEMPGKDGITAAAELTTDPSTKDIPVIFVTNLDHEIVDALAKKVSLRVDAKSYFRKDGDYNFLIKKIRGATTS